MTGDVLLAMRDVARVHGAGAASVQALRGVSLEVAAGELLAVMGPSGSGKSTLLNLAGGLDTATSGEVFVEGTLLAGLSRTKLAAVRRRSVGYVFQELNLIPALTAVVGFWATLSLNIPDFTRYAKSQKAQLTGQAIGLPTSMTQLTPTRAHMDGDMLVVEMK